MKGMAAGIALKACIYISVFLIGTVIFSFLGVLVDHFTKEKGEKLSEGRSKCPVCGHKWKYRESIPVFSWIFQRGRCMYCFERIPARYTMIELLGGILSIVVIVYYGISLKALTLFLLYGILTMISWIDIETRYIPPALNVLIAVLGVLSIWTLPGPTLLERGIGMLCVSIPLVILGFIIPDGFGGGDIKMMATAGIFLGWKATITAFFIALILGGAYGIYLLLIKKKSKKDHFAFGPFLSIGIAIAAYGGIGTYVMNLYLHMIQTIIASV